MAFSPFPAPPRPQTEPPSKPPGAQSPIVPAADLSVFSMFPQHETQPEPAAESTAVETLTPAEAEIRAMIVPIDAPPPAPIARAEPARVGAIGTWQRAEAPIEAPPPPAPMRQSPLIAEPPAPNFAPVSVSSLVEPTAPVPQVAATPAPVPAPAAPQPDIQPPPPAPADHPAPPDIEAKSAPLPVAETETTDPDIEKLLVAPRVDERLPSRNWLNAPPESTPPETTPPEISAPPEQPSPPQVRASLLPTIGAWQIATAVSLMIAIAAIVVAVTPRIPTPLSIAAIGVVNAPAPLYLAETDSAGKLKLTALATISVPNGRDLQLWIIPPGEQTPASLGVLPARGTTVTLPAPPAEGTRFVISMEPRGGAPAGRITGQVLYGGTLANR